MNRDFIGFCPNIVKILFVRTKEIFLENIVCKEHKLVQTKLYIITKLLTISTKFQRILVELGLFSECLDLVELIMVLSIRL